MRLYHVTTQQTATSILRRGFPVPDPTDATDDAIGAAQFRFCFATIPVPRACGSAQGDWRRPDGAVLEVTFHLPEGILDHFAWIDELSQPPGWTPGRPLSAFRQWFFPTDFLNDHGVVRLVPRDEALRRWGGKPASQGNGK